MLSIFKKNNQDLAPTKTKSFKNHLFLNPYNHWLLNEKHISRAFLELIDKFNPAHQRELINGGDIIIQPVSGEYSCLVQTPKDASVLLLFPELISSLKNVNNERALSILAHEFGHLYYQHHRKNIATLEAQIEADDFAYELGLAHSLVEVLLKYQDIDSQTRVSVLTAKILAGTK